jgi:hypothetical protein
MPTERPAALPTGEVTCGGLTDLPQGRLGRFTGFRFTVDVNPQFALELSVMSDQRSPSGPEPTPTERLNPYVIEHYGFAASSEDRKRDLPDTAPSTAPSGGTNTVRPPVHARRRRFLAAGALGLVLTGGIGGVATAATADTGPGPHRGGDRGGVVTVDAPDGVGQRPDVGGLGGRR